jgi:hypothetical protein
MMPDFSWQGRQPRAVQADGMVAVSGGTYGPLSEDLLRRQVDVDIVAALSRSTTIVNFAPGSTRPPETGFRLTMVMTFLANMRQPVSS